MQATIKEIKSESGLYVWVCVLNGTEIARALSLFCVRQIVIRMIIRNTHNGRN